MTRPTDRHLNDDELSALVCLPGSGVTTEGQLSDEELRDAQDHVESCRDCDRKMQMHRSAQSEISRRTTIGQVAKGPNCSDEDEWVSLVAGLAGESEAKERMKHAAQCGYCGPLLKAAAEILSDEATADEEVRLAKLASTRTDWQAEMALTLGRGGEPGRTPEFASPFWKSLFYWPRPAFAVAAIVVIVAVGWIGVRMVRPPSAEKLLAQAYTEHRTIEVRIPDAKYAPLRVERSGADSNFEKPESLLRAEALIRERLRRYPNDPEWLEAKARAELLDGSYDDAIKTLKRALESRPDSPQVLTDLGSAYFLRAQSTNRPIDYGNAIELLGKVLAKNPDDPIALFNRALACEQMFLYAQSIDDWDHYLRVDPRGEWADEARKRLENLRNKVQKRDQSLGEPLATPSQISGNPDVSNIDRRIEEYLDRAVTDWLPQVFQPHASKGSTNSPEISGLRVLSRIAIEQHNDPWFEDLLAGYASKDFPVAIKELSAAVQSNERADTANARLYAVHAASLFADANNVAGVLRAQIEVLAALNTNGEGSRCNIAINSLADAFRQKPYHWLLARFEFEAGTCAWLREELGSARLGYKAASKEAKAQGFQGLYLRAQDRLAGLDAATGLFDSAWKRASDGLVIFWSGNYPDVRGYNFYFDIYELTRLAGQPHTQVAAWRDGIRLTESSPDIAQRAMAHLEMGTAAEKAGMLELSKTEFARADELFRESPKIPSTELARLEAETRLAGVESSEGNARRSVARMKPLQPEIDRLADNYLGILFYTTLGQAEGIQAEWTGAEDDLEKAVSLSQRQIRSLEDPKSRFQVVRESSGAYRALVQRQLLDGKPERALDLWESFKAAPLGVGHQFSLGLGEPSSNARLSQAELSHYLPTLTKETVISYALLPNGLAIWVMDERGVFSHWEEGRNAEVLATAARLRELCEDPQSDWFDFQRNARELYDALIAPIQNHLDASRTILAELDDGLDELPLEALMNEHGRYLGDMAALSISPGIYYRDELRTASPVSRDTPALIVEVPNAKTELGMQLPSLPDVLAEAELVNRSFNGATLLEAGEATKESVLERLRGVRLFHFAGHAIHSPGQSGILLSDALLNAGSIPVRAISQLRLVVLSACETQSGPRDAVNDADSMVRMFLQAGVPNVVASRWKVDSGATRRFMELFYQALLDGNSVSVSIQRAESELRSEPGTSHPYYWSAFGAFGAS